MQNVLFFLKSICNGGFRQHERSIQAVREELRFVDSTEPGLGLFVLLQQMVYFLFWLPSYIVRWDCGSILYMLHKGYQIDKQFPQEEKSSLCSLHCSLTIFYVSYVCIYITNTILEKGNTCHYVWLTIVDFFYNICSY